MKKTAILSTSALTLLLAAARADVPAKVTFNDHVLPIFRNACLNCHNPDKKKAGLDLSTYQATIGGSDNGKIVESGNPGASLLFKCVKQTEEPKMPPRGDRLTDNELAVVEKWIAGQLLETANSKGVAAGNNVQTAVVSLERPAGPPPMPGDLPLEPFVRARSTNALVALAASPWAPLVAVGGQKQVLLYNTETLQPLGILPFPEGFPAIVRFSRNGKLLLTGGGLGGKSGQVVLWDVQTGERVGAVGNEFDQVLGADLSPDQAHVALGGPSRVLKIYSTKDGKLEHSIKKHTDWVTAVAFSPDGAYLASADRSGGIVVWEGATGKEFNVLPGHKVAVTALSFMPGVLASASKDGTVVLWDVKEGKEIRKWNAHKDGVEWVDFTPDGRLVTCGRDRLAKAWDSTGKSLFTSAEFGDIALRAALNNDRVVAGDWTGAIKVFTLSEPKGIGELTANPPPLAEQLAAAQKRLEEAKAAVLPLQQAFAAAEEKTRTEAPAGQNTEPTPAAPQPSDETQKKVVALSKTLEQQNAEVTKLREERAKQKEGSPEYAAADGKVQAKKAEIAKTQTAIDEAGKAPAQELAKAKNALDDAQKKVAALSKTLEQQNAEVTKLREERAKQKEGSPEYAAANDKVQAKKAEIAKTQASIDEAGKAPAAPAQPPAVQALAKAKATLDEANAKVASATSELERWQRAQSYMMVHSARQTLADKTARHEELVAAAKDAFAPVEKLKADIATTEKLLKDLPGQISEKQRLVDEAKAAVEPLSKAIGAAEQVVAEKETGVKNVTDSLAKATAEAGELPKKLQEKEKQITQAQKALEKLEAEISKRREERGKLQQDTPEYAAADAKVQGVKPRIAEATTKLDAIKAEIALMKTALETAQADQTKLKPQIDATKAELVKAQETLEKARAELKSGQARVAGAEKAVADATKSSETAKKQLTEFKNKLPEASRAAQVAKSTAEKQAALLAKELESAKSQAERAKAEFETKYRPAQQSASTAQAVPPAGKS